MFGFRNPPTQASCSLSCLIFADTSLTSDDARARHRRTKALPIRPYLMSSSPFEILNHSAVTQAANTSTQTKNDSSQGILCRESISDNHSALATTILSLTSSAWPGSIHFASGRSDNQEKLIQTPQTTIARIRDAPAPISAMHHLDEPRIFSRWSRPTEPVGLTS